MEVPVRSKEKVSCEIMNGTGNTNVCDVKVVGGRKRLVRSCAFVAKSGTHTRAKAQKRKKKQ